MSDTTDSRPGKLYLRTWPLGIAIGILATLLCSLFFKWRIGSPEQSVVLLASIAFSLLFIYVARSRGRFRLTAILILMVIVSLFSATIGRELVLVQNQKRVIEQLIQRNFQVQLAGASRSEESGWLLTRGGYAIPAWFRPAYNYFANNQVVFLFIPADLLTMNNLHDLRLDVARPEDGLWNHELWLEGDHRDPKALLAFSKNIRSNWVQVRASRLKGSDIEYLSHLRGVKKISLTLESPTLEAIAMCQDLDLANLIISNFKNQDTVAPFAFRPDLPVIFTQTRLTAELAQGLLRDTEQLQVEAGLIEQKFIDEMAKKNVLRTLMVSKCTLKEEAIQSLAKNESILELSFFNSDIPTNVLRTVAQMKQLKNLTIDSPKFRCEDVQDLCRTLELEYLYINIANPPEQFQSDFPLWGPNIREVLLGEKSDEAAQEKELP